MDSGRGPTLLHAMIGGACLELLVHDDPWLSAVRMLTGPPDGPVIGRIECGGQLPLRPEGRPDFIDGDATGWTQQSEPLLVMGEAHVSLGEGVVTIAAEPGRGPAAFDRALPMTLTWLLGPVGLWVVHGAAIVGPDGLAVMAVGPGGAGKSTVAAAAIAAGWPVLADDLVVVRLRPDGTGTLEACGVPRPLAVPAEFSHLGPAITGDVRDRRQVSAVLTDGWWPVGSLAVLAHGTAAATVTDPLGALDAFRAVRTAHFVADVPARRAGWFTIAAQLARLPALSLALGTQPSLRLASTTDALDQARVLSAIGSRPPPH